MNSRWYISYKKIIMNLLLLLWIALEVKWFYIPENTQSILVRYNFEGKNLAIVAVSCLLLFFQMALFKNKKRSFVFKNQIFIIWSIWIIAYLYAVVLYRQDAVYTFVQFVYFGLYVFYFAALWYFEKTNSYDFFSTVFAMATAVFGALIVVQVYAWQTGGETFLTVLEYLDSDFITRYGVVRVMAPAVLLSFSSVLSFGRLFQEKKRNVFSIIIDMLNALVGTVYVFYACGTRFLMLVLMISYGMVLICRKERQNIFRSVIIYLVIACAAYYALTQNVYSKMMFSTTEHSFTYRMGSFVYFLKQGLINPLCGLGFLTDRAPEFASLLHGAGGEYYISDVGICGFVGQMGIIAAVSYAFMVAKIWKLNNKIKKIKGKFNPIILSISCYVTLTLATLSLQTNYTIVAMVLSLLYTEQEYRMAKCV